MRFPAWLYHRVIGPVLFGTAEQHAKLDNPEEWSDTPADWHNPAADCCAAAGDSRGMRHAADCTFGAAPEAAEGPTPPTLDQILKSGYAPEAAERMFTEEQRAFNAGEMPYGENERTFPAVEVPPQADPAPEAPAAAAPAAPATPAPKPAPAPRKR